MEFLINVKKQLASRTLRSNATPAMPLYVLFLFVLSMMGGQPSQANAAEKCNLKILNEICLGGSLKKYASHTPYIPLARFIDMSQNETKYIVHSGTIGKNIARVARVGRKSAAPSAE